MIKNNNFIALFIAVAGMLTACTEELVVETPDVPLTPDTLLTPEDDDNTNALFLLPSITMQEEGTEEQPVTRASYYDGKTQRLMFEWKETDVVGMFPCDANASQQKFDFKKLNQSAAEESGDGVSKAVFKPENTDFQWRNEYSYRAYYPYTTSAQDITSIAIDYSGQTQTAKPDFSAYKNSDTETYYQSELNASAHLTAKTFIMSNQVTPSTSTESLSFKMKHVGGVVRFYLVFPETVNADITEIKLVATKPVFHENATINVLDSTSTPTGEATNVLSLSLAGVHVEKTPSTDAYGHYLLAYMMAYPVKLTEVLSDGSLYIYTQGTDASGNGIYYRSISITKKDINAGGLTQFSVYQNLDDPISMQPIGVEEWKAGLEFSNDGKGTEDW